MSETVSISMPLVNAVASYLADRPYREVAQLLADLDQAVRASRQPPERVQDAPVG